MSASAESQASTNGDVVVDVIGDLERAAGMANDRADILQAELGALHGQLAFTAEEQAIVDHIEAAFRGIQALGLRASQKELAQATHSLQMFVLKHAMQRLGFKGMSRWFWSVGEKRPPGS